MRGFYLDEPVEVLGLIDKGWCLTRWAGKKPKIYRQWFAQITVEPYGEMRVAELWVSLPGYPSDEVLAEFQATLP